jgi:hypothetical protein
MRHFLLQSLIAATLVAVLTGCTITPYVKDVHKKADGTVAVERCGLTVYLAFYGLIAKPTDCREETL